MVYVLVFLFILGILKKGWGVGDVNMFSHTYKCTFLLNIQASGKLLLCDGQAQQISNLP
jgi:hypothetical protein